jgi:hypothetical protein
MANHIVAADSTVNNSADFPGYRAELPDFPELPEADALEAFGFTDVTCGTSLRAAFLAPDGHLRVGVEHPDPAERLEDARYVVRRPYRGRGGFDPWMADSYGKILYEGNDWRKVARLAAAHQGNAGHSRGGRRHG